MEPTIFDTEANPTAFYYQASTLEKKITEQSYISHDLSNKEKAMICEQFLENAISQTPIGDTKVKPVIDSVGYGNYHKNKPPHTPLGNFNNINLPEFPPDYLKKQPYILIRPKKWVEYMANLLSLSLMETLETLFKRDQFDLHPDYIFKHRASKAESDKEQGDKASVNRTVSPSLLQRAFLAGYVPRQLLVSKCIFNYIDMIPLQLANGMIVGCTLLYKLENGSKILGLPAKIKGIKNYLPLEYFKDNQISDALYPGHNAGELRLYRNPELIKTRSDDIPVLFFDDLLTATRVEALLFKAGMQDKYVVTAIGAGEHFLEQTDLSPLTWRNVFYIPKATRESFNFALLLYKRLRSLDDTTLKVVNTPIVYQKLSPELKDLADPANPFDTFLTTSENVVLTATDANILCSIFDKALTMPQFVNWGRSKGLFKESTDLDYASSCLDIADMLENPRSQSNVTVRLDCFSSPGELGVIAGPKNCGKSLLGLTIAVARSAGVDILGYEAFGPEPVLIVDAETSSDRFIININRTVSATQTDKGLVGSNLHILSLHGRKPKEGPRHLLQDDDKLEKEIEKEIRQKNIKLLLLDNLISLIPGFRKSAARYWPELLKWVEHLESQYGTSVLLLHHTNKAGESSGSKDIEVQAANVMILDDGKDYPNLAEFRDYLPLNGALCQAHWEKCKSYPHIEDKPFGLYLAYEPATPIEGPPWEVINLGQSANTILPSADRNRPVAALQASEATPPIPEHIVKWVEEQVFSPTTRKHIMRVLERGAGLSSFTRKDVERCLNKGESTANAILKLMSKLKLISKLGENKDAAYRVKEF